MRSLLDVSVLVAILDRDHTRHDTAADWLVEHLAAGWASCSITQIGATRVLSQPAYSGEFTVTSAGDALRGATSTPHHEFWADGVSVVDPSTIALERVHGARQITDVHLLALAVSRRARLVTLDRRVPLSPVVGATSEHLVVL